MKVESFRQFWTKWTQIAVSWAPVGAKKVTLSYITVCWRSSYVLHFWWLMLIDRIGKIFVNIFVRFLLYCYITRGHTESLRDISSRAYLSNNQTLWHYISHHSGPILDVWWHVMAEIGLGVTFWFPTQYKTHASLLLTLGVTLSTHHSPVFKQRTI